jgi:D-lactate dehydrogenase
MGTVMTKTLHGFGCHILGYDIEQNTELGTNYKLHSKTLKELFALADIISIPVTLNTETHQLINEDLIYESERSCY